MRFISLAVVLLALLSAPLVAGAAEAGKSDAHEMDGPKHGGQFVELKDHHGVEMVVSDDALKFYLSEDHKPVKLDGAKFRAIVQTKAGTKMHPLTIQGDHLTAQLKSPLPKGAKIVITGKDAAGHTLQARFVKK